MTRLGAQIGKLTWIAMAALLIAKSGVFASERVSFVVPSMTIYPGQPVNESGLSDKLFFIGEGAADQFVLRSEQVSGKIARKTLLAGKPIALSSLGDPSLVKRGVPVVLVFNSGPLSISTVGTPLESGAAGDFIKVRNNDSGIVVSGTILADGRIQVGLR